MDRGETKLQIANSHAFTFTSHAVDSYPHLKEVKHKYHLNTDEKSWSLQIYMSQKSDGIQWSLIYIHKQKPNSTECPKRPLILSRWTIVNLSRKREKESKMIIEQKIMLEYTLFAQKAVQFMLKIGLIRKFEDFKKVYIKFQYGMGTKNRMKWEYSVE